MTTEEKLNAIMAKCRAFLEIAAKRTPGKWKSCKPGDYKAIQGIFMSCVIGDDGMQKTCESYRKYDAAFIAACAGQAEAMARSTIAAIQDILDYPELHGGTDMEAAILAAWPEERLC